MDTPTDQETATDPARDLERRNTETVLRAMRELFVEGDVSAVDRYWAEPYVQHNPSMPDGLDTLRAVAPTLSGFVWEPRRIAAQGDLVFTHSHVLGWAEKPVVIVDVFRLAQGRIVEHWDVVQEQVDPADSVNGNPMV
ncbi:nuclear transport factor 2 family protein [Nocardiopsis flavescens]|uniref:Predicted SnoaL-like aldol condensation-catalyzing enzyme n=1 Tax=Nocardiopsis flavescens TaxID=758803 RepID=A0A1M6IPH7_9ACTN|nr:nuclear transport factor 2 family protein [Nocardiopsis flavescens]SHJ36342.1 Predicted SnoaL-like aldol condensation-catalyzing enzyme [Nocardiopsis flavescens]